MKKELLRVENLAGSSSPLHRISDVWLNLFAGRSLGLYGLYGGAPSALLDMISGRVRPSQGRILVEGQRVGLQGEEDARKHGIYRIGSRDHLISSLSVAENIFLLRHGGLRSFWLNRQMINGQAARLLEELGIGLSADGIVSGLTTAQKHLIELAKAVGLGGRIIIFDYAFASYTQADLILLNNLLHPLREQGVSLIVNSNSMEEIRLFCDEVVFFRNDSISKKIETSQLRQEDIPLFLGADPPETTDARVQQEPGCEVFSFRDTVISQRIDINIPVYRGSITTVVCTDQFVRESLFMALSGQRRSKTAVVHCCGQPLYNYHRVSCRSRHRIAAILPPQDVGVFFDKLSTIENLLMPSLKKSSGWLGTIPRGLYRAATGDSLARDDKAIADMTHREQLSLCFERWLIYRPNVAILYEPFLVSDATTCELIKQYIVQLAAAGTGVLIITARLHSIADITDKVVSL